MLLIPAFEIGVWNAWIFMLAFIFFHVAPAVLLSLLYKGIFENRPASVPYNKTEKKIEILLYVILCLLFIYSIFLPLPLGTTWFYTGLSIFILGVIVFQIAGVPWATTPPDEPVTKGLYRYSRHPIYLAMLVQLIGVSIASASWIFLLLTIVFIILMAILVIPEEHFCLKIYGDSYREYMNRTPRWIGMPK
jgi:protein-S-isoprenylcysteine O-methyltransferase Ste14